MERVRVYDKDITYQKVYRSIKYPRLELRSENLLLVLPQNFEDEMELIRKHRDWVYRKASLIEQALQNSKALHLKSDVSLEEFKCNVMQIIRHFSKDLNVEINCVFFRKMKTKWGSCSSKGNLTINPLLRLLPRGLIEYVLLHEIVHKIHRKHNEQFHKIIEKKFKNLEVIEEKLFAYWFLAKRDY